MSDITPFLEALPLRVSAWGQSSECSILIASVPPNAGDTVYHDADSDLDESDGALTSSSKPSAHVQPNASLCSIQCFPRLLNDSDALALTGNLKTSHASVIWKHRHWSQPRGFPICNGLITRHHTEQPRERCSTRLLGVSFCPLGTSLAALSFGACLASTASMADLVEGFLIDAVLHGLLSCRHAWPYSMKGVDECRPEQGNR